MRPNDAQKTWLEKVTQRYQDQMTAEVLTYLERRGIGLDDAIGYRLGYVGDPDPLHEDFYGRLSIPFITPTGIVYIRFRCLEAHECSEVEFHGKYEGAKGTETHLYNVMALHDADTVVGISEGELDALVATSAGLPTVGVPGSNNWKPFYYRLFDDFSRVVILGDGDRAGRDFTNKLAPNIPGGEAKVMPPGHDVNSYVLEYGAESFLAYVKA